MQAPAKRVLEGRGWWVYDLVPDKANRVAVNTGGTALDQGSAFEAS